MSQPASDLLIGIKTIAELSQVQAKCIDDLTELVSRSLEDLPVHFVAEVHQIVSGTMAKQAQLVADARLSKGLA